MRFQKICSTSALLLLANAGTAFAAEAVASTGHDNTGGDSNTGATLPCAPATAVTAKAGTNGGEVARKPCATTQAAPVAQATPPPQAVRLAEAPPLAQVAQTPTPTTPPAQEGPQAPAPAASQGGEEPAEVVVTGSRIARKDFVSNQPIVSVSSTELASAGKTNIESALEQTPQFANGQDENYNSNGPNGGRATLNLRGLGQTRTLVLLDGRRLAPTDGTGVANLNEVPQSIVSSVEVISGGASAAYGSDAMAGVVNIITKNIDGVEIGVSHGAADGNIGKHQDYYINVGSGFADNRGHVIVSYEHTQRDAILGSQIPFFFFGGQGANLAYGAYSPGTAPLGTPTNLPSQNAINAYFAQFGAPPGAVKNSTNLGFNNDGTLFTPITPWYNYKGPGPGGYTGFINVGGVIETAIGQYAYVTTPEKRDTAFVKATYDLTENQHVYVQALATYNRVDTQNSYQQLATSATLTIPVTNPFIPSDLSALLATRPNPTAAFTFNKRLLDFPPSLFLENFDTDQFLVGANGKIPWVDFDYDIYYQHDYSLDLETDNGIVSNYRVQTLLSAPDGGNAICAGGFNPFQGAHSYISAACQAYLVISTHASTVEGQDTVEGNLSGKIIDLPAGEARFALTGDWRQWNSNYSPDSVNVLGNPPSGTQSGATTTKGQIRVSEEAAELLVPILKDMPAAKSLNINLGFRHSDYNISGTANTYKFATDWRPTRALLFRGGYEHAIRAPNINDLFQGATPVSVNVGNPPVGGDPCDYRSAARNGPNAAAVTALCVAQGIPAATVGTYQYTVTSAPTVASGSLNVKPEIGNTYTFGTVFTPDTDMATFQHLQLSLDYYHIKISDAIGTSGYLYVLNQCYNATGANPSYSPNNLYCQLLDRNFGGVPGSSFRIGQPSQNLGGLINSGIDLDLDWHWRLDDYGLGKNSGQINLNSATSWIHEYEIQLVPGSPWLNYTGSIPINLSATPAVPVWHTLTTLSYSVAPVPITVGVRWRYIDGMRDVSTVLNPTSTIPGVRRFNYFDLVASWNITDHIDLSGTVTNLSGQTPPVVAGTPGETQPALYDIAPRTYLLTLHAKF
jgi:outer membrane receptor protein involved in Fe transport